MDKNVDFTRKIFIFTISKFEKKKKKIITFKKMNISCWFVETENVTFKENFF